MAVVHYQVGDEPIPGYRLRQLIGPGRLGQVWKATAPGGAEVALKIVPFDSADVKKVRNLRLITYIKHPNLVPILALWLKSAQGWAIDPAAVEAGTPIAEPIAELIIAMGLGDKSLAARLKECQQANKGGIPTEELLDYLEAVARGADHLAQPSFDFGSGPVAFPHCNVKPSNILVVGGAAQLGDAGLAMVLADQNSSLGVSACYQAPELFMQGKPTPTSDQYSLAITYVELRTGVLPFRADSLHQIISAHLQGLIDLSKLPEAEHAIIKRATAVDPTQRWPRALDMVRALRQIASPVSAGPSTGSPSSAPRTGKRNSQLKKAQPTEGGILLEKGLEIVPGYRLVRPLGRGGYGEVWEASAPGHLRIALKIVRNLENNTGKQEFKALQLIKNVNHVYLLALHAYWLLDVEGNPIDDEDTSATKALPSMLVLATRLADKNLMQRLKECRQEGLKGIPNNELLGYMKQAAAAIDYLNAERHQLGDRLGSIQHRDIKPENILLTGDIATVADFGLAKLLQGANAHVSADSVGLTLLYAAPELLSGSMSNRSDQYSLAITYYHMRSGAPPFSGDNSPYAVIQAHVKGNLDLSLVTEAERRVLQRGLHLDPQSRYPTCTELVKSLEEALQPAAVPAMARNRPAGPVIPPAPPLKPGEIGSVRGSNDDDTPGPMEASQMQTLATPPERPEKPRESRRKPALIPPPEPVVPVSPAAMLKSAFDVSVSAELPPLRPAAPAGLSPLLQKPAPATPPRQESPSSWRMAQSARPTALAKLGKLKYLLIVLVLGGAAAAGGWFTYPSWKHLVVAAPKHTREAIAAQITAGQYQHATQMVAESGLPAAMQDELRGQARTAWLGGIEAAAKDSKDEQVAEQTLPLLEAFPGDPRALELRRQALDKVLPARVEQALKDQMPPREALKLVAAPQYDSPLQSQMKTSIRQHWLGVAQKTLNDKRPANAATVLDDLAAAFPGDAEVGKERTAAHTQLFAADFERLTKSTEFASAGKLLSERKDVLGPTAFADWQPKLVNAWLERARQESDKQRKVALLRGLLAYSPNADARKLLKETDPNAVVLDPARAQALAARLAEGQKKLAGDAPQALRILDELLKDADVVEQPALQQQALLDLARAQARTKDWKGVQTTLARRGADPNPTNRACTQALALLADEGNGTKAVDLLKPLSDLAGVKDLDGWERDQTQQLRSRAVTEAVTRATELRGKDRTDDAFTLVGQALACDPANPSALVLKADLQYRKADFSGLKDTIKQATAVADSKDRADLEALGTLAGLRPSAAAAERTESGKQAIKLLATPTPRQGALALALASAARTDPALRATSGPTLKKLTTTLPDGPERTQLVSAVVQLATDAASQADRLLRAKNFTELAPALAEAEALALDDASKADVEAIRALGWLQQPEQRQRGVEATKQLLARPTPPRPVELCNGLIQLTEADDKYLADTRQAVDQAVAKLPAGKDREQVQDGLRRLAGLDVRRRLGQTEKTPDWSELLKVCQQAEKSYWSQVGQAEALIELNSSYLKQSRDLTDAATAGAYTSYVRALQLQADKKPAEAAAAIVDAYRAETPAMLTGFRRERALRILDNAIGDRAKLLDAVKKNPLQSPFGTSVAAEKALPALGKAIQLQGNAAPLDLQVLEALAAAYQPRPPDSAAAVVDAVIAKPGADKLPGVSQALLLARARSQPALPQGKAKALQTYDDLGNQLSQVNLEEAQVLDLVSQVLEPALKLAEGWPTARTDTEIKKRYAHLNATLGKVLADYPTVKFPGSDGNLPRSLKAYSDALALDRKPQYYIDRGLVRSLLPDPDLRGMVDDANEAIKLGAEGSGAHGLRGFAQLIEARREADPARRDALLEKAVADCNRAVTIKRGKPDDPSDLPTLLANLSTAALERANYLHDVTEQRPLFAQAKAAAEEATRIADRHHPENAWRALGNVCEDIASQLRERPKDNFSAAINAFNEAIKAQPQQVKAYLDLGRCLYKAVAADARPRGELADAVKALQNGLERKPAPDDKAKARYWLGLVYLARSDYDGARGIVFDDVIREAQGKPTGWLRSAIDWALAANAEAGQLWARDPKNQPANGLHTSAKAAATGAFDAVKASNRPEDEPWRLEAALALGQVHETYTSLTRALAVYREALSAAQLAALAKLPADQPAPYAATRFRFLIKRGQLVLENRANAEFIRTITSAGGPVEAARADLVVAVNLARSDPNAINDAQRLQALSLCGMAHERCATVNNQPALMVRGAEYLEEAKKVNGAAAHPEYWVWCFILGKHYSAQLDSATGAARKRFYDDGLSNLQAARDACPADARRSMEALIAAHERKKP